MGQIVTFGELVTLLRTRGFLLVGGALIGVLLATIYTSSLTPRYGAGTTMYVSYAPNKALNVYQASLLVQSRMRSYPDLVDSPEVLAPVIAELDLDETPASLRGRVAATNPQGTVLLKVEVEGSDAAQTAAIANAVSEAYGRFLEQQDADGSDESPLTVDLSVPATAPGGPTWPKRRTNQVLGLVVGAGIGFGLMLLFRRKTEAVTEVATPAGPDESAQVARV